MKITAITCHSDRPGAWDLCCRYMARQTRQPDQWLILDDSVDPPAPLPSQDYHFLPQFRGQDSMIDKILYAVENGLIKGDAVVWFENDDYYFPDWIEWCEKHLSQGFDLVGQGLAIYYNVAHRWWSKCNNPRHASLCNTAMSVKLLEVIVNIIEGYRIPWIDTYLWRTDCAKYLQLPVDGEHLVFGIKGMPGYGYSREHRKGNPKEVKGDPSLMKLWKLIGKDAAVYSKFKQT